MGWAMSEQTSPLREVWVCGIYNWPVSITKEERIKNPEYPRYNWVDIDTTDIEYYNNTLAIFKKYGVSCIGMRCGKGYHVLGDEVSYDLWRKIWFEIKPFADPKWAPHTIRISKKRNEEVWERPVYYNNGREIQPWMKAVMSFICKAMRGENSTNLYNAMHHSGLDKYFQCIVYKVELK